MPASHSQFPWCIERNKVECPGLLQLESKLDRLRRSSAFHPPASRRADCSNACRKSRRGRSGETVGRTFEASPIASASLGMGSSRDRFPAIHRRIRCRPLGWKGNSRLTSRTGRHSWSDRGGSDEGIIEPREGEAVLLESRRGSGSSLPGESSVGSARARCRSRPRRCSGLRVGPVASHGGKENLRGGWGRILPVHRFEPKRRKGVCGALPTPSPALRPGQGTNPDRRVVPPSSPFPGIAHRPIAGSSVARSEGCRRRTGGRWEFPREVRDGGSCRGNPRSWSRGCEVPPPRSRSRPGAERRQYLSYRPLR